MIEIKLTSPDGNFTEEELQLLSAIIERQNDNELAEMERLTRMLLPPAPAAEEPDARLVQLAAERERALRMEAEPEPEPEAEEPAPEPEVPEETAPEPEPEPEVKGGAKPTVADALARAQQLVAAKQTKRIREALEPLGVARVGQLKPSQVAAFLAAVED